MTRCALVAAPRPRPKAPPAPFRVAVDTREQTPWTFAGLTTPDGRPVEAVAARLGTADYADADRLDELGAVLERKSGPDLLGCMGRSRERFERELARLDAFACPAVVVEVELSALLREPGGLTPAAIVGTLLAWQQRHAARWLFAPSRPDAERLALRWLHRYSVDVAQGKQSAPQRIIAGDAA